MAGDPRAMQLAVVLRPWRVDTACPERGFEPVEHRLTATRLPHGRLEVSGRQGLERCERVLDAPDARHEAADVVQLCSTRGHETKRNETNQTKPNQPDEVLVLVLVLV